eukprot:17435-Chlamydomonas_euryale.AAC.1
MPMCVMRPVLADRVLQRVSNGTYRFPVVKFQTGAVQVILPSRFSLHTEDGTCLLLIADTTLRDKDNKGY